MNQILRIAIVNFQKSRKYKGEITIDLIMIGAKEKLYLPKTIDLPITLPLGMVKCD